MVIRNNHTDLFAPLRVAMNQAVGKPMIRQKIVAAPACQIDRQNDSNHDVHDGNEDENDPPEGTADDFQYDDQVVDWNDGSPSRFAGFGEDFPEAGNEENDDRETDEATDHFATAGSGVFFVLDDDDGVFEFPQALYVRVLSEYNP